MNKFKISVLTGAGMSQESGINTFRDANGLWENHDIMEVASFQGWLQNPSLVLEFYNKRRAQLKEVSPNEGHLLLAEMQNIFDITIITQNVDNLHEKAGSLKVLHLHGELLKVRSEKRSDLVYEWHEDLNFGDLAEDGSQLRPAIVWFGEAVPLLEQSAEIIAQSEIVIIVGTSLQVYPAASLYHYAPEDSTIYYVDKNPAPIIGGRKKNIIIIPEIASKGIRTVFDHILTNSS